MKIVFLGTNGWYDTATGNTICILARTAAWDIILDAGYGLAKADRYGVGDNGRPVFMFLSHFHLDHVAGLHTLVKFSFPGGLTICGPAGARNILTTLVNQPFTVPLQDLPYPAAVLELPDEGGSLPFPVTALPLRHASLTLGFRLTLEGLTLSYCPDTGYCANAVALCREADLAIAECAYRRGQGSEDWPHLNPETAARIAWEARAKRLALVHFDARIYPDLELRREAEEDARVIFPASFATYDDLAIELNPPRDL
ncbi:MAG: MBL fold metallo-hydrolase [Pseudomonadota bacterium]|nr:MBL fold metallo-hydrolase [Pseudomonadota bacterium]